MAENKLPFVAGASINRSPMFSGVNYQFWKVRKKKSLLNQLTVRFGMELLMIHLFP